MRIYLDACCYNRPFDDPGIRRNHLESEAILGILAQVQAGRWVLVGSEALEIELTANPLEDRRQAVLGMLAAAQEHQPAGAAEHQRSDDLARAGFAPMDALHIACAEAAACDVLLSADDRLLRRAARLRRKLRVDVRNPLDWLLEQKP